jgi:hypothetical protein
MIMEINVTLLGVEVVEEQLSVVELVLLIFRKLILVCLDLLDFI